jgi:hypothetical protein
MNKIHNPKSELSYVNSLLYNDDYYKKLKKKKEDRELEESNEFLVFSKKERRRIVMSLLRKNKNKNKDGFFENQKDKTPENEAIKEEENVNHVGETFSETDGLGCSFKQEEIKHFENNLNNQEKEPYKKVRDMVKGPYNHLSVDSNFYEEEQKEMDFAGKRIIFSIVIIFLVLFLAVGLFLINTSKSL